MNLDRATAPDPYTHLPQLPSLEVSSSSFAPGEPLPDAQAYGGGNTSPQLSWSAGPEGTAGYLVTCFDPDAPTPSGFWHWAVYGVPADVTELSEGSGSSGGFVADGMITLTNDYGTADFGGAAPPPGDRPHRYIFAVTALDTLDTGVDATTSPAKAHFLTLGNSLARGVVTGTYQLPG